MGNIFIDLLWWTVKYHYLHLHSFANGVELKKGLKIWFEYYNRGKEVPVIEQDAPDRCYLKDLMKQAA